MQQAFFVYLARKEHCSHWKTCFQCCSFLSQKSEYIRGKNNWLFKQKEHTSDSIYDRKQVIFLQISYPSMLYWNALNSCRTFYVDISCRSYHVSAVESEWHWHYPNPKRETMLSTYVTVPTPMGKKRWILCLNNKTTSYCQPSTWM